MQQVEREHVREWLQSHRSAAVVPSSFTARFARVVNGWPWESTITPPWKALPAVTVDLDGADWQSQVARTAIGTYEYALLMYPPDEPGIIAPLLPMLGDIDVLTWTTGIGWKFVCGAVRTEDGGWDIEADAFAGFLTGPELVCRA